MKIRQLTVLGRGMLKRQWDLWGNWKQILNESGSSRLGPPAPSLPCLPCVPQLHNFSTLLLLLPCCTWAMAPNTYSSADASWLPIGYTLIINAVQKPHLHETTITFTPISSIWLLVLFQWNTFSSCAELLQRMWLMSFTHLENPDPLMPWDNLSPTSVRS